MSPLFSTWFAGLLAALGLVTLVWLASLVRRDASIIDMFWGAGFFIVSCVYFTLGDGWPPRKILVLTLVGLWGLRLSAYIAVRNHGKGEDYRYRAMRERHGAAFPWVSLATVFLLQGLLMWLISAPLLHSLHTSGPAAMTWLDVLAVGLFAIGLTFETVGDFQLARFKADASNRGRVMQSGLWRYTRHPNYFGDAVVWWSFFVLALATPGSAWTIFSPVLMTFLLLKVSGVGLLEKKLKQTRPEYEDYVARTNAFIPWRPRSVE